jgi:lipopolysaccharide/colanic/teichoic acid biosynthesis glycosyltransferase
MTRRALDVTVAVLGLALLWPVLVVVAIAVAWSSPGPVLHRAQRVGRGGQPFTLFKFRTMVRDAAASGPGVTAGGDARITKVGRVLRRTKLDELPQLVNVLLGDMSLVGPRPEDERYVQLYTPEQRRILDVRPGITSPASITYRDEEAVLRGAEDLEAAYRELMAEKIRIDLDYLQRRSVRSDLGVLWRTALAVVND